MKQTAWLMMTAAMAAGCGDNSAVTESGDDTPETVVPSAFVNGMPGVGVFAVACTTRFTLDNGVFDCPNVEVEPNHYRQTCPDGVGDDEPLVSEIWYDDQQRTTREHYEYAARAHVLATDTTYTYDELGLRHRLENKITGELIQDENFSAFTDAGNPLAATIDWPEIGNYAPSSHITESYSYDEHDRIIDQRLVFSNGGLFLDLSFAYDDAAKRRTTIPDWGAFASIPAFTGAPITEDVDSLGRLVQRTIPHDANNLGSSVSYFYDAMGRQNRTVASGKGSGPSLTVVTDRFFECE